MKVSDMPQTIQLEPLATIPEKTRDITGKIIDEKGQALAGVTIIREYTDNFVKTDENGNFTFSNLPNDVRLIFSGNNLKTVKMRASDIPKILRMSKSLNVQKNTNVVSAKVVNEQNQALSDITVWQEGTDNFVKTDENGRFTFSNLPNDAILIFSGDNLESTKIKINKIPKVIRMQRK